MDTFHQGERLLSSLRLWVKSAPTDLHKKPRIWPGMMAHAYNPSYSRSGDEEDRGYRSAQAKS
jgi:hypothetical protein